MEENKLKIIALLIVFFGHAVDGGEVSKADGMEAVRERRHPIVEAAMALFSMPTTFPDTSAFWTKLDSLIRRGRAFFSPPNLDFRGSEVAEPGEEGTAGEKVKEAVVKSVDKSKAAIEDSAKSAAKLAGETVDKATQKLKKTLSNKNQDPPAKAEL